MKQTYTIPLTREEIAWLVANVHGGDYTRLGRARLLSKYFATEAVWPVEWGVTEEDLYYIDDIIVKSHDPYHEKLADGQPLETFARKIWECLVDADAPEELERRKADKKYAYPVTYQNENGRASSASD